LLPQFDVWADRISLAVSFQALFSEFAKIIDFTADLCYSMLVHGGVVEGECHEWK
jgi:hypothetical protein